MHSSKTYSGVKTGMECSSTSAIYRLQESL